MFRCLIFQWIQCCVLNCARMYWCWKAHNSLTMLSVLLVIRLPFIVVFGLCVLTDWGVLNTWVLHCWVLYIGQIENQCPWLWLHQPICLQRWLFILFAFLVISHATSAVMLRWRGFLADWVSWAGSHTIVCEWCCLLLLFVVALSHIEWCQEDRRQEGGQQDGRQEGLQERR